jgi:hypothetical protein
LRSAIGSRAPALVRPGSADQGHAGSPLVGAKPARGAPRLAHRPAPHPKGYCSQVSSSARRSTESCRQGRTARHLWGAQWPLSSRSSRA